MTAPDPRKSHFWFVSGIKGSGKTEYAWWVFDGYPFDRMVLDVTHDVTELLTERGVPHHQLTLPLPGSWPDWLRDPDVEGGRLTLVFKPDMGTPEAIDDLDRCVGLCLRGGGTGKRVLCWADEVGEVSTQHRTGPGMRRALHHGRHDDLSLIMCGPRAKDLNTLCIGQADTVVTFRTLNKHDREAIAGTMGVDQGEFDAMNKSLRPYEHTVWHRETEELAAYEPLPMWRRGRNRPAELDEA